MSLKIGAVLAVIFVFLVGGLFAAEISIPKLVKPGDLFILKVSPDGAKDKKISIVSEIGKVQFMGAVQGTPDIQMPSDSLVEIEPKIGSELIYELKYLALSNIGESNFKVTDFKGARNLLVKISEEDASKSYSLFILAGGLILLVIAIKLWKFQKSSPSMMSTKSLFMNFDELEKARKLYFGDDYSAPEKPEADKKTVTSKSELEGQTEFQIKPETKADPSAEFAPRFEEEPDRTAEMETLSDQTEEIPKITAQRPSYPSLDYPKNEVLRPTEIIIELNGEDGRKWESKGTAIKVGRRRDNQIILTASEISREHICFFSRAGKIYVKPLTISNVTQLNGKDLKGEAQITCDAKLNLGGSPYIVKRAEFV